MPSILNHYLTTYIFPGKLTLFAIWNSPKPITLLIPLILFILGLLMMTFAMRRNKFKLIWNFFLMWLIVGAMFHSQLIPLDATVADRWFYFTQIGLLGLVASIAAYVIPAKRQYVLLLPALVVFPLLMYQSRHLLSFWQSELTLVSKAYEGDPQNYLLTNSLGYNHLNQNQLDLAEIYFKKTVHLSPEWGSAWNNLGYSYYRQGKLDEAQQALYQSINVSKSYLAYANLAQLMIDQQHWAQAQDLLTEGVQYYPNNPQLWYFLAMCNDKLNDRIEFEKAYATYQKLSGNK